MSKLFNIVQRPKIQRSAFNLSHERKLSGKMGILMPILCQEVVPGDHFKIDTESMIRFAPMVAPIMHRINSYIHYFYVPNRVTTPVWENFITGKEGVVLPTFNLNGLGAYEGSIADLLGIPYMSMTAIDEEVNDLPFRAFFQIYKDYYIDENLSSIKPDTTFEEFTQNCTDYSAFFTANTWRRAWEKDYFTSALPWAQKGNPVTMDAIVNYSDMSSIGSSGGNPVPYGPVTTGGQFNGEQRRAINVQGSGDNMQIKNIDSVQIEIEELRRANRLQRWLERNARAGTRYVEHLLSHWGVKSSDARLQRAEFIGGGRSPVVISETLSTYGNETSPQGNMAGHGINVGRTNHASKFVEEHGFIIGIMSILPEPNYQQGLPKLWSRKDNLDFYFPEFAQLGEQPILNKELMLQNASPATNDLVWGYQSRWSEYKYAPSTVHGKFRSTLDYWHAGRIFATLPALNEEFIECDTTEIEERIFAVTDPLSENLYIQVYHNIAATRPLPFFNMPTL